ncbi:MAG: hypothetical protein IIA59_11285 [Candidatus Marinimicrobia bacterium]|nr:hypothetical protein [Candidatus Neomarinimicrobiota bacterium]
MTLDNILLGLIFLANVLVVSITLLRRNDYRFSRFISVNKIGIIERDLHGLVQVVVVAQMIEKPSSQLEIAVQHNFERGIKYLFLVSESTAEQEVSGYYLIFEALAKIAIARTGKVIKLKELIDIKKIAFDWTDAPYVFYQYIEEGSNEKKTILFKGNQRGEGIADYYERIPSAQAMVIANSLLANAPQAIGSNLRIPDDSDLLPLKASDLPSSEEWEKMGIYPN